MSPVKINKIAITFIIIYLALSCFYIIGEGDSLRGQIPFIKMFQDSISGGFGYGYFYGAMGGVNLIATNSSPLLTKILYYTGIGPQYIYNILVICIMFSCFVFSKVTSKRLRRDDYWGMIFLLNFTLGAFVSRINMGHLNLCAWFAGVWALFALLQLENKCKHLLKVFLLLLMLDFGFSFNGYQLNLYSLFYLPLFLIIVPFKVFKQDNIVTLLAGILLILYSMAETIILQVNGENARSISSSIVYEGHGFSLIDIYLSGSVLTQIFDKHLTENFASFEILLLILVSSFLRDKFCKTILGLFLLTFFMTFAFSSNFLIGEFVELVPVLNAFRIPQRMFLVFSLFLVIIISLNFSYFEKRNIHKNVILIVIFFQIIYCVSSFLNYPKMFYESPVATDFNRHFVKYEDHPYGEFFPVMNGINSMDGHAFANYEFLKFMRELRGVHYSRTHAKWNFSGVEKTSEILPILFNIGGNNRSLDNLVFKSKDILNLESKNKSYFIKNIMKELRSINFCENVQVNIDNNICIKSNEVDDCTLVFKTNFSSSLFLRSQNQKIFIPPVKVINLLLGYKNINNNESFCIENNPWRLIL